jgi:hypothetical protein
MRAATIVSIAIGETYSNGPANRTEILPHNRMADVAISPFNQELSLTDGQS